MSITTTNSGSNSGLIVILHFTPPDLCLSDGVTSLNGLLLKFLTILIGNLFLAARREEKYLVSKLDGNQERQRETVAIICSNKPPGCQ